MVPTLAWCPHVSNEETDHSGNMHSNLDALTPDSVLLVPYLQLPPSCLRGLIWTRNLALGSQVSSCSIPQIQSKEVQYSGIREETGLKDVCFLMGGSRVPTSSSFKESDWKSR